MSMFLSESQVKNAQEQAQQAEILSSHYQNVLSSDSGRAVILDILQKCAMFSADAGERSAGKREIAFNIANSSILADSNSFDKIMNKLTKQSFGGKSE